jgi:hypothetical protein
MQSPSGTDCALTGGSFYGDRKSIGGLVRRSVEQVAVDLTFSKIDY